MLAGDLIEFQRELLLRQANARRTRETPGDFYQPHAIVARAPAAADDARFNRRGRASGQLQFHQSKHPVRIAAPGNGWGGTTAMACEIDAWCRHTNRWQHTPDWPIIAVWFCPEFRQFDIVRKNLEEMAFGTLPTFKTSGFGGPHYEWPDGSTLYLASYDRSWSHLQGIELDLVAYDEQPPPELYREMLQRRRAKRKTRFICKATQTKGRGWMGEDVYEVWKKHHQKHGISDEEQMMEKQLHPMLWVWPRGGIHDNPGCDAQDVREYEERIWPTKLERKVRVFGGFESFNAQCIFDAEGIAWLRNRRAELVERFGQGRHGSMVLVEVDG